MSKKYDVLATGNYTVDLIFTGLPGLPEMGKEVISSDFNMTLGEGYISVAAMHRLGLKVGWAADFGSDDFSRFAMQQAQGEGLDRSLFQIHKRSLRRISVAASFPADRAFITYYDPDPPVPAAMLAIPKVSARTFYVPGFYYGRYFDAGLLLVRARRMKIVMDGNSGTGVSLADPAVRKAAASVDVLLPNAREASSLTGEDDLEKALKALGALCKLVVIKAGPQGAYAYHKGELYHAPAIDITPVDTTGAGDCFNAGFLKAWLNGQPLEECLRWGNIVGGLSTLALGGTGRLIQEQDVREWLNP